MKRENKINKKAIPFSFKTDPGKRVFIAGTFNEWDARELELNDSGNGDYSIALDDPTAKSLWPHNIKLMY